MIVGDVPPTYIPADDTWTRLRLLMVTSAPLKTGWRPRAGKCVAKLIPVNVDANPASAEMLASRLKFLDEKILPLLRE